MIKFRLNTGASIPAIGLGTWQVSSLKKYFIKNLLNINEWHL